jgi:predicted ATP-dependent endonuclease of OLD family
MEDEGDGLRSFVAICMCLALSRRPVCIIDEPEICLHPPQAYALGRIIARQATSHLATTLVSTHSSHVLRGVISQSTDVQIIRLTRAAGQFSAHMVDSHLLRDATEKPLVRAETIFDGMFADGVVLVESEGDRAVYQAVWESTPQISQLDILFVPLNGKGPMADVATFFSALRIPVAVVADLDLIKDDGIIPKLLVALTVDPDA